jgi:spoIIIJ-associated protein
LSRDQVEIEIIRPGSRGLLGLLGEEAVVRVSAIAAPPASVEEAVTTPPVPAEAAVIPPAAEEAPMPAPAVAPDEVARLGTEVLQDLLNHMGLQARVTREAALVEDDAEPGAVLLNINGADLGVLIGRQGETLRDLQFLTCLIISRHTQRWPNVIVDVEHYKSRRQKSLVDLAKRMAERVRITAQPVSLEPMPPHERRIVHLALREDPDVFTESMGQDEKRKVVIMPKR